MTPARLDPVYDATVAGATALERLVYRSRLLGADPSLVVHGGGNTSSKVAGVDHRGRERPLMLIKASGADLATIGPGGFAALYLDDLLALRDREALSDEEVTAYTRRCLADPSAPRPSIETLLHGFLPARHVDHVHADAVCALTNGPDAASSVSAALGADVPLLPWIRPGFELARRVSELADAGAVVLAHHGLVTWADDPAESLARTTELVERARAYVAARRRSEATPLTAAALEPADAEATLLALRGRLCRASRRVLHVSGEGRGLTDRSDVEELAGAGPGTADHLLRTRPWAALVRGPADVAEAVDRVERRYTDFWQRNESRAAEGVAMSDPAPAVALVPGLGLVAAGSDARRARVVAETAARSLGVAATVLDAWGQLDHLAEEDLFDIDAWPLERAKLASEPAPRELEGCVVLVTGAASGIGRDVARGLVPLGAHLVLGDRDAAGLDALGAELALAGSEPVVLAGDLTDERVVDRLVSAGIAGFGGIDGAVSNAGIAGPGRLADLTPESWRRSLEVNATSHFLLTRRLLPALERQGLGGSLVFVASKNAFSPGAGFGAYSAAKAAEVQLARMAALEGGAIGVRANVINPDAIFAGSRLWSDELRQGRASAHGVEVEDLERFYAERNLLGREVRGSDVAEATAFLLSERSSRTTGCVITVDGGVAGAFPR